MTTEEYIENLKRRLLLPLPGKEFQFRMAPSYRPAMDENVIYQQAGVMILLYRKNNSLYFPLIERPQYNGAHSGQISFPGGKLDIEDRNLTVTALRECEEEIGVDASKITVLGSLTNLIIPVSKFDVYPTVGLYNDNPVFVLQKSEVVEIIEIPLDLILSEQSLSTKTVIFNNKEEIVPYFNIYNKFIWGATAMILSEFIQIWKESNDPYSVTRFL